MTTEIMSMFICLLLGVRIVKLRMGWNFMVFCGLTTDGKFGLF